MRCIDCGAAHTRPVASRCMDCSDAVDEIRRAAISEVAKKIRSGALKPAKEHICADCGKSARDYDHRDYRKPLEVEPVCRSCNWHRGPAKWATQHDSAPLLDGPEARTHSPS